MFDVYGGKGMQIQGQLDLLTSQGLDEASERTSCLKDRKLLYDVYH